MPSYLQMGIFICEKDIPSASVNGKKSTVRCNDVLRFWMKCGGDSLKGLRIKACTSNSTVSGKTTASFKKHQFQKFATFWKC